ncbi:hypothetical protein FACUT_13838 [Fusarium acutatum]|uniref:Uncharacterized protein n=1 Tax=Fusarium acutatum TaxID=78861 RepID=A0A8H4J8D4_9HYPO|nr:hypothetical protein FACUT_13838 [Fusarium acutatum]
MSKRFHLPEIPAKLNHGAKTQNSKSKARTLDPKSTRYKPQRIAISPVTIPDHGDSMPPEDENICFRGDAPTRGKSLASFNRAAPQDLLPAPKWLRGDNPTLASTVVNVPAIDVTPEFIKNPPAPIAALAVACCECIEKWWIDSSWLCVDENLDASDKALSTDSPLDKIKLELSTEIDRLKKELIQGMAACEALEDDLWDEKSKRGAHQSGTWVLCDRLDKIFRAEQDSNDQVSDREEDDAGDKDPVQDKA